MFFEDENGWSYPVSSVVRVRKDQKANVALVDFADGGVRVNLSYWERVVERRVSQICVAQPDTYVLDPIQEGEFYELVTVVGWAILENGEVAPVTGDGIDERTRALVMPNGRVIEPEHMMHRSVDAYLKNQNAKLWVDAD
ncbi:MAG TPA: hypothetical protein PLQ03_08430 [Brevundimonas sp.]|uniref:hypothetical protein n=1 Tax=Brevundimonas sp. TaxID=1871086 RepID=UPI002607EE44|nr:hypothetical protein [Brevundimonas sp.]HRO33421.1 hypothetical protein [Brevundimonas sp.]